MSLSRKDEATFDALLRILLRWDGPTAGESNEYRDKIGKPVLDDLLRSYLLEAAWKELEKIRQYLTMMDVIKKSFWHRNERGVLKPYWRMRHRQSFHDGVCLAQLLVAIRQTLNDRKKDSSAKAHQPPRPHRVLRIATAIAGNSSYIADLLGIQYTSPNWSGQEESAADG